MTIKTKRGKMLSVPNTRGYTQYDPVIDDLETYFDSPLGGTPCGYCGVITYLTMSNLLPTDHKLDAEPYVVNGLILCSNCYLDFSNETIAQIRHVLELCNSYKYELMKYANESIQFEKGYLYALKNGKKK